MPRVKPRISTLARGLSRGPEHNLVQSPELVKNLATFLGMRQQHVTPALQEGIQPVVIVGDIAKRSPFNSRRFRYGRTVAPPGGVLQPVFILSNTGALRARVKHVDLTSLASAGGFTTFTAWLTPTLGTYVALAGDNPTSIDPMALPTGQGSLQPHLGGLVALPATSFFGQYFVNDGTPFQMEFGGDGFVVDPGSSLVFQHGTITNGSFILNAEWTEESIA